MRLASLAYDTRAKLRALRRDRRAVALTEPETGRSGLRGPLVVQVQTVDRCPASCVMCPNGAIRKNGPAALVSDGLYARLLSESRGAATVTRFVLMLQNEPLLDAFLESRVRAARASLGPSVELVTVTNGERLSPARAAALFDAGLSELAVSVDARTPETYGRIRVGLDFETVCRNIDAVLAQQPRRGVVVRFVRQRGNQHEERDFVRYWTRRGARVFVSAVVNRAGSLQHFHAVRQRETRPARRLARRVLRGLVPFCTQPFTAMAVLADGRVIPCCHDWGPTAVVGDLSREPLEAIWNGPGMRAFRRTLMTSGAGALEPCAGCSLRDGPWGPDSEG